jgi:hypothetical protein
MDIAERGRKDSEMSEIVYERPKAIIVCDYDEFDPYSYRGVVARIISVISSEDHEKAFFSKSPLRDKNAAIEYAKSLGARISVSSSWDNFLSDALMEIVKISKLEWTKEEWEKILFSDVNK